MAVRLLDADMRSRAERRDPPARFLRSRSGFYNPDRERLLLENKRTDPPVQARMLAWLRDHVHAGIPRAYYQAVLGHDLHVAVWAELFVRHYHDDGGWWENLGRVSQGKITVQFRDYEVDTLQLDPGTYDDFKYHEVGLSNTAESNAQTGLISTSGITRVAGSQSEFAANVYQTVATITADTTEVWQEHGVFNTISFGAGQIMLDRSLISPTVSTVSGDSVEFTYLFTKSAEP